MNIKKLNVQAARSDRDGAKLLNKKLPINALCSIVYMITNAF